MLNLQLGIRYSVGKHASRLMELWQSDFDPKEKLWTRFPPEGSKFTPPHQSVDFKWKDYCPMVFRSGGLHACYCGNDALRELSSPGKSGSFFYLTQDDRFMIQTVKQSEVKDAAKLLPACLSVQKFLGDSSLAYIALSQWEIKRQIDRDCDDYLDEEMKMLLNDLHLGKGDLDVDGTFMRGYHLLPDMDWVMEGRVPLIRLGANMRARAQQVAKIEIEQLVGIGSSNSTSSHSGVEIFDAVLYFGIIDILQDYDISKKLEHVYKSLQVDAVSISDVDPKLYSKRFRNFIYKIFRG